MYALTIKQPWASAIMAGLKRVENRTWRTDYRGPLAIHAGLSRALLYVRSSQSGRVRARIDRPG